MKEFVENVAAVIIDIVKCSAMFIAFALPAFAVTAVLHTQSVWVFAAVFTAEVFTALAVETRRNEKRQH